jgi:hypothetical protein
MYEPENKKNNNKNKIHIKNALPSQLPRTVL